MTKTILWNARSVINKKIDIEYLIQTENPEIFAICETWLTNNDKFDIKDYDIIRNDRIEQRGGGLAICIKNDIQYKKINLNELQNKNIETLAIKISYKRGWLHLLLIYNPCNKVNQKDMEHYINQIEKPKLIIGDFNAHHPLWNSKTNQNITNITGINLFNLINQNNILMLTPKGQITRIDPKTGKGSTIDLVLGTPELSQLEVEAKIYGGSDHLPIIIRDINHNRETIVKEEKWKFNEEGWIKFKEEIQKIDVDNIKSLNEITEIIKNIGMKHFRLNNDNSKNKPTKPWWNKKCKEVIKQRNKSFNKWRKNPNEKNRIEYKKLQIIARDTIEKEKRTSWSNFCHSLDFRTPTKKIWNFIKKLSGSNRINNYPLIDNDQPIQETKKKLKLLKEEFQSIINTKTKCLITKSEFKSLIELPSTNGLNKEITLKELISVIKKTKNNKACGPDSIPYEFYKNIPNNLLEKILNIYNQLWIKGEYPIEFKKSLVNPILKPDKDPANKKSYRFISRISCIGKMLESIINNRLIWWLEKNNKLSQDITGFRPNSSTIDTLQIIDFHIKKAYKEKKYALIASLDLEKAFDKVNHDAIIIKAAKLGITGTPLRWISNFLNNRSYQIIIGNQKSEEGGISKGLPQGSPLSPLLFNIMMSDLNLTVKTNKIIYADDINIITINENLEEAKINLEVGLNKIVKWANDWELKLNLTKSKVMCFTKKRIRQIPIIKINNEELKFTNKHTILGLEFDAPKLKWKNHINNLKIRCTNRINIMKKLSTTTWGANRETMIKFYDIYIKPKIEYGITIYGTANDTEIKKIETVQNGALRIATGCLKTTPINALYALTNKMSIKNKLKEKEFTQMLKILEKKENTQIKKMLTENIKEYNPQKDKNNLIHRIIETNKELQVKIKIKTMSNITPIPPWFDITKNIETKFLDEQTKNIPEQIIRAQYIMLENTRYRNYKKLFTDGSKINNDSTSAAIYIQDNNITTIWKLPNNTEIIEAELFAIKQGLKYIQNNKLSKSVLFTDSKSALQLISNPKPKNSKSMTFEIQELIYTMVNQNQIIMLQWIPSHKNIKGNEIVDQAAKKAHKIRYPITIHEDTKKQIKQMKKKKPEKLENSVKYNS